MHCLVVRAEHLAMATDGGNVKWVGMMGPTLSIQNAETDGNPTGHSTFTEAYPEVLPVLSNS